MARHFDAQTAKEMVEFLQGTGRNELEKTGHSSTEKFEKLIDILKDALDSTIAGLADRLLPEKERKPFRDNWRRLELDRRITVVAKIYEMNLISQALIQLSEYYSSPATVLFNSLNSLLGIGRETIEDAPDILGGHYQFWRYSNTMLGCYVKGLYVIKKAPTGELAVEVQQFFNPGGFPLNDPDVGAADSVHLDTRVDSLSGIAIRMAGDSRILVHLWDAARRVYRINVFNRISYQAGESSDSPRVIKEMSGIVSGIDDNTTFVSPVYVERISEEIDIDNPNAMFNTYTPEETPLRVRANLRLLAKRSILTD
jgi:hypothetical protein